MAKKLKFQIKRNNVLVPALFVLILLVAFVFGPQIFGPQSSEGFRTLSTTVTSVHDGDTFHATVEGRDEKIRLIGVNTPELDASSEKERAAAQAATEYTASLVEHEQVWLVLEEVGERDRFGRILAYVWLIEPPDTEAEMRKQILEDTLNGKLITSGNAKPMTIEPNTTFADVFKGAAH